MDRHSYDFKSNNGRIEKQSSQKEMAVIKEALTDSFRFG